MVIVGMVIVAARRVVVHGTLTFWLWVDGRTVG